MLLLDRMITVTAALLMSLAATPTDVEPARTVVRPEILDQPMAMALVGFLKANNAIDSGSVQPPGALRQRQLHQGAANGLANTVGHLASRQLTAHRHRALEGVTGGRALRTGREMFLKALTSGLIDF